MSYDEHREQAQEIVARCAVVTVSDTRTPQTDASGKRIVELLVSYKHIVGEQRLVPDDPSVLGPLLDQLLSNENVDVIITNGGTGISSRDQTVDVVEEMLETALPGFGELFRMLSWRQIGSGAMLSRAVGGAARGKLIFALPGSTAAVETAMNNLILPELRHMLMELRK